ncbi:MAG: hypothetical protein M0002_07545 [Rhodospirillales bacterium]|nr:hypothetical protein [Rhodospirillales bacterium]
MSLYREAITALKQVLLLDEQVRNAALDVARMSQEVADLRDRVSRLEGMLAGLRVQPPAELRPPRPRRLPPPERDRGKD